MLPDDRFTAHGYLDNPYHTRNLNPSGVLRSLPGIGFGWHYPAYPRSYGYREVYRAGLRLYLVVAGRVLMAPDALPDLHASRHTMNEFVYRWSGAGLELEATFFRIGEHALACRARLCGNPAGNVRLGAALGYTRRLGAAGGWGESGLVGRVEGRAVVLQGFEDGDAFALAAAPAATWLGCTAEPDDAFWLEPALAGDHVVTTGRRGDTVHLHAAAALEVAVVPDRPARVEFLLARALRRDLALAQLAAARLAAPVALSRHRAADASFWRAAPRLTGAWPEHWRRGLVYDFETLRMMVRAPIGIYTHPWDAMQIQAPRVVLAEAAIDALLLSYADPGLAKALLLGTFLDAPAANVPCSREDGSYNMVGANGSACGTAPEWGYPIRVAAHLHALEPDPSWLEAIMPALERYLRWWQEHRSDDGGYLVYDNSWESGQDLSARFGPQKEGGGSTIRAVRPVDLQAAMADACATVASFARELGRDAAPWEAEARRYRELVEGLWHDGGYRDYDARAGWSDVWDVMQLAPVALGLAPEGRAEALRGRVARLAADAYLWPMFVWTASDAALQLGERAVAAELARATVDRAYRAWDRREHSEGEPLPGVTCEYWGTDGRNGAEGYGWGAFGVHLIFRTLLGYRPRPGGFELHPNLPPDWPDGRYGVANLHAGAAVDLSLVKRGEHSAIELTRRDGELRCQGARATTIVLESAPGASLGIEVLPP